MNVEYAQRINKIPAYLFAEIDRQIQEKKKEGMDVIKLSVGDPDLPTPENVIHALKKAVENPKTHQYPSYTGMLRFREAVANHYKRRFNVELDANDEIIALIGSKEGIAHTPVAFVDPKDKVLVPDPAYPVYKMGTILAGGEPVAMPLLKENGFKPDLDAIDEEDAEEAKLMFFNYPNAPTGAVADKKFFQEVVEFAREHDIIVCHDNPYSEMTFDGYEAPSFLEVNGAKEVGVEFNSLSKTFNMTGWRIGMVSGNPQVIAGIGKVKENVDSGAFQAVQYAGIEALSGDWSQVEKNMQIWKNRRDVMVDGLKDLGWDIEKPKATFYLWFEIPEKYDSSMDFCSKLLNETGVVATPGVGFGEHGEGYVRFALTQEEERLKEAVERIKKLD